MGAIRPIVGICQNPACGQPIPEPTYRLGAKRRERRKYCRKACWDSHLSEANRRRYGTRVAPLPIPDSARRVTTWAGVPAACYVCAGQWKRILGGVSCLTCGRDLYVAQSLEVL